jgi:hypothetical protein
MGAVVSCIENIFGAIGSCIMAVVNAIASVCKAIINVRSHRPAHNEQIADTWRVGHCRCHHGHRILPHLWQGRETWDGTYERGVSEAGSLILCRSPTFKLLREDVAAVIASDTPLLRRYTPEEGWKWSDDQGSPHQRQALSGVCVLSAWRNQHDTRSLVALCSRHNNSFVT